MSYPDNDNQFEDKLIEAVTREGGGYFVITCDGWSLGCGDDCPVMPQVGQTARRYGCGIGSPVRGLFIDGVKVWYRTEAEEKDHSEIQLYGADAADWLSRWDAGRSVSSIEMGGIGPGCEQAIQITAAEILRHLIDVKYDAARWSDSAVWKEDREQIDHAVHENPTVSNLGLSGSQWGAAMQLATKLYMDGPRKIMNEPSIKDRHIQVSKRFPSAA